MGIDISKDTLDWFALNSGTIQVVDRGVLDNEGRATNRWLGGFEKGHAPFAL